MKAILFEMFLDLLAIATILIATVWGISKGYGVKLIIIYGRLFNTTREVFKTAFRECTSQSDFINILEREFSDIPLEKFQL